MKTKMNTERDTKTAQRQLQLTKLNSRIVVLQTRKCSQVADLKFLRLSKTLTVKSSLSETSARKTLEHYPVTLKYVAHIARPTTDQIWIIRAQQLVRQLVVHGSTKVTVAM